MHYDKIIQENIDLSEVEEKIIDLEDFQRLKLIKQNGFSYVMYPDARNTRYDHSIGTMYWATELYRSICGRRSEVTPDDEKLEALRLAALIHDIGHGPFSHAIEIIFDRNPELLSSEPWKTFRMRYGNKKPHELMTMNFVDSTTFTELVPKNIVVRTSEILTKKSPLSLLISGDIDADRLDYLTRDSQHSGIPFGFNVKAIFKALIQENIRLKSIDSENFLLIDSKVIPAFEQLLMARYAHYFYIAYAPTVLSANLAFVSKLEKRLWDGTKNSDEIAQAIYLIFSNLTDDTLLDLDFKKIERNKRKLLDSMKDSATSEVFKNLKKGKINYNSEFVKLSYLGKKTTYNFFKAKATNIQDLEKIMSNKLGQPIEIQLCLPQALTTRTLVFDKDIKKKYTPSFAYDFSPVIRALEQKMYLDCGIIFFSETQISRWKLCRTLAGVHRPRTDFDMYTYAILKYIDKIEQYIPKKKRKWQLRRSRIFEFLNTFMKVFSKKGYIKNKIAFRLPYYSEEIYEMLQKLEFLDVLDEDFNLSEGDGVIPCYLYSKGEYAEQIVNLLELKSAEKHMIEKFVEKYIELIRRP